LLIPMRFRIPQQFIQDRLTQFRRFHTEAFLGCLPMARERTYGESSTGFNNFIEFGGGSSSGIRASRGRFFSFFWSVVGGGTTCPIVANNRITSLIRAFIS